MPEKPPVYYSKEIFDLITLRIAAGESVSQICKGDNMPVKSKYLEWVYKTPEHREQYARAIENRASSRVERIDDYGDMLLEGKITSDVARVLIDKERWQAGKENPKKYSDKQQIELTGKDGEPLSMRLLAVQQRMLQNATPEPLTIENTMPSPLDDII